MGNKIKNILFLVWAIVIAQVIFAVPAYAQVAADSAGLFDNSILQGMHLLMTATYKTMGSVLMIGHSLMCYAIEVDKTSVFGVVEVPNIGFLMVGLGVYVVGIFMSLSIGMYFVDASLRLGVAIIFMPISIALWPFPPTSNKFADNLGTIIRNGMLMMLTSVGVAYAVCLINAGLFEGGDQAFWYAIEHEQTETISENFSLFSSHILVIGFSLAFGFRILESSVNDYLNAFFSDAMFGSQSPMNQMATQAFGMAAENIGKPALDLTKDIAMHQAGNVISGVGSMMTSEGRGKIADGVKNAYNGIKQVALNPRQSYNNAMKAAGKKVNAGIQKAGAGVNSAIQTTGKGVKAAADALSSIIPLPFEEDDRQRWLEGKLENGQRSGGFNGKIDELSKKWGAAAQRKIDGVAPSVGNFAENVLANGGKGVSKFAATVKEGAKQAVASGIADGINDINSLRGADRPAVTGDQVREGLRNAKTIAGAKIKKVANTAGAKVKGAADKLKESKVGTFAAEVGEGLKEGFQTSDQAPITLNPSDVVGTPIRKIRNWSATMKQLANMPKAAKDAYNTLKDNKGNRVKIIAKATGQVVMRTAKDAKTSAGNVSDVFGKTLQDFGAWVGDNSKKSGRGRKASFIEQYQAMIENERRHKEDLEEARDANREMDVRDK